MRSRPRSGPDGPVPFPRTGGILHIWAGESRPHDRRVFRLSSGKRAMPGSSDTRAPPAPEVHEAKRPSGTRREPCEQATSRRRRRLVACSHGSRRVPDGRFASWTSGAGGALVSELPGMARFPLDSRNTRLSCGLDSPAQMCNMPPVRGKGTGPSGPDRGLERIRRRRMFRSNDARTAPAKETQQ